MSSCCGPRECLEGDVVIENVGVIMSAISMIAVVIVNQGKGHYPSDIPISGVRLTSKWKDGKRWDENKEMVRRCQLMPNHLGYVMLWG